MTSSRDAFARFEIWKKSETFLKVTLTTKGGKPEILRGQIVALDEDELVVGSW
jgi:hypothetical protein